MPIKSDALFHMYEVPEMGILFLNRFKKKLLIYLAVLVLSCGMRDLLLPPRVEPGPLHWEPRVLATGPPRESLY